MSETASAPLNTSPTQLMSMLRKAGGDPKKFKNADKLDVLEGITDEMKERLTSAQKMDLQLPEINQVLVAEGMKAGETPKDAMSLIWRLRLLQLARRASYVNPRNVVEVPDEVPQWLVVIPEQQVNNCLSWGPIDKTPPRSRATQDNVQQHLGAASASKAPLSEEPVAAGQPPAEAGSGEPVTTDQPDQAMTTPAAAPAADEPTISEKPATTSAEQNDSSEQPATARNVDTFKTSVHEMKVLFLNTGLDGRLLEENLEKLDMVSMIAEQVKECIKSGTQMEMSVPDLNAFNVREGMPEHEDAVGTVESLLQLRQFHLERLAKYVKSRRDEASKCAAKDKEFVQGVLMVIATEKVRDCFAAPKGQKRPRESEGGDDAVKAEAISSAIALGGN